MYAVNLWLIETIILDSNMHKYSPADFIDNVQVFLCLVVSARESIVER